MRFWLAILLLAGLSVTSVSAQSPWEQYSRGGDGPGWWQRTVNASPWLREQTGGSFAFGRSIAVVIGIGQYENFDPLKSPPADARRMTRFLIDEAGFDEVYTLTDDQVSLTTLSTLMNTHLPQQVGPNDRFLFYWSGHGGRATDPTTGREFGFLPLRKGTPDGRSDVIDMDSIRRWLRRLQPRHALFVFDACYSGNVFTPYAVAQQSVDSVTLERLSRPSHAALSSSASNQASYGYKDGRGGVFTSAFLDALRGGADTTPRDGFITLREISAAVQRDLDVFAGASGSLYDFTMTAATGRVGRDEGEFFFIADQAPVAAPTAPAAVGPVETRGGADAGSHCAAANDEYELFVRGASACWEVEAFLASHRGSPNCTAVRAAQRRKAELCAAVEGSVDLAVLPPPPPAPSSGAFGIPAERWTSGTPGADLASFREGPEFPEMVVIPAGSYMQGSTEAETTRFGVPDQFAQRERPQRTVRIARPFALARTEVTVGEWRRFIRETGHAMGDSCWTYEDGSWADRSGRNWQNPSFAQGEDHPVACVSWEDAQAYVTWLNGKAGRSVYRLPSESEWEYAARAGTQTARYWGEDAENTALCRHANGADATAKRSYPAFNVANCDDGYAQTAPVGRFTRNRFGLSDILGNLWEWTEDCFEETYSSQPANGDAYKSQGCSRRVLRGGSWDSNPRDLRSANRYWFNPGYRGWVIGFRLARVLSDGR